MPHVEVLLPSWLLNGADSKRTFKRNVRSIVAEALDCTRDNGAPMGLRPEQIDVILQCYQPEDVELTALIVVRVEGFPEDDRMKSIQERLNGIGIKIGRLFPESRLLDSQMRQQGVRDLIEVKFFTITSKCWVALHRGDIPMEE